MSRQTILTILCALIVVITINRVLLWGAASDEINRVFYGFDTRADGLLIGCLLGLIASWGKLPSVKWFLALPAALTLLFATVFVSWDSAIYAYGLSLINLSVALVLAFVLTSPPAWLSNKVLVWIGTISYGLYLWHNLVFVLVRERVTDSPWGIFVLGSLISIPCAALSYYLLEKPCLKFKERFTTPAVQTESIDQTVFNSPASPSLNT